MPPFVDLAAKSSNRIHSSLPVWASKKTVADTHLMGTAGGAPTELNHSKTGVLDMPES